MIARLQRCYPGGDPACWLYMRPAILEAFLSLMPRLEAEDRLAGISATAAGTGKMKPADRRIYLGKLQKLARGKQRAAKATMTDLETMGIEVIQE